MQKVILITGATDGIGFVTAKQLVEQGHRVLLHGRNSAKLQKVAAELAEIPAACIETYTADLSKLVEVRTLATELSQAHQQLDVVINNAGVYQLASPMTEAGFDTRFVVNTLAPYLLTQLLLPLLGKDSRVVNLSSAAQTTVNIDALLGHCPLDDNEAYAQSKLALSIWSQELGLALKDQGPMIVSVNPKSFLGSKMVKEAYGVDGNDLRLGADILVKASLSDDFSHAGGRYFDNDREDFGQLHPESRNKEKVTKIMQTIELLVNN